MATITSAQIQALLASLPPADADQATVSQEEAQTFNKYCTKLLIENQVFPLASDAQVKLMSAFDGGTIIEETENLNFLAFCVFSAIESKNTAVLSYIKAQRPHTFIPALKIAIERALVANREGFFDALFSQPFKKHLTSEVLADSLLSPHNPNFSLFILNQMNVGFFKDRHIVAAVQSAVDFADCESSPLSRVYLNELLKSAHNTCKDADYVKIFTDSCVKNSPDNRSGLRALLSRLSEQGVTDVFCSVVKMDPAIVKKVLPIIFEERGHDMDIEAVIQHMTHGDARVASAAKKCPALWDRIPQQAPASDGTILVVEA